jgi:hypothetical protein
MFSEFDKASREYESRVDHRAAELVRQGYAPWTAIERAVNEKRPYPGSKPGSVKRA